jgi:sortase B
MTEDKNELKQYLDDSEDVEEKYLNYRSGDTGEAFETKAKNARKAALENDLADESFMQKRKPADYADTPVLRAEDLPETPEPILEMPAVETDVENKYMDAEFQEVVPAELMEKRNAEIDAERAARRGMISEEPAAKVPEEPETFVMEEAAPAAADGSANKQAASGDGEPTAKPPKKKNRALSIAYRVIMLCLVAIICVSGFNIYKIMKGYKESRDIYSKVQETAKVDETEFTGIIDFDALKAVNPEIVGWIYQKDTVINYPVTHGTDNDKYLHTAFDGTWNGGGCIFLDCNNEGNFSDFNNILYGHHMKDGSMFRCLRGYTKEENYYDGHKQFELITPDAKYHLIVFAAYITPADSQTYTLSCGSDDAKQEFIGTAMSLSEIKTDDLAVGSSDRIVTLSTCAYDYDEARYVVVCKMVPWTDEEIAQAEERQKELDSAR